MAGMLCWIRRFRCSCRNAIASIGSARNASDLITSNSTDTSYWYMYGDLFIKKSGEQTLDIFVSELIARFGCKELEERFSSSYVDERYFLTLIFGIEIRIAYSDDSEFADYDFWLSFNLGGVYVEDKSFFSGLADCVARKFAISGYQVARPLDIDHVGFGSDVYRLNADRAAMLSERVVVQRG